MYNILDEVVNSINYVYEGATLKRGFNRAFGTIVSGILAIAIAQLALHTGRIAEPIVIGVSIFIVGKIAKQTRSLFSSIETNSRDNYPYTDKVRMDSREERS